MTIVQVKSGEMYVGLLVCPQKLQYKDVWSCFEVFRAQTEEFFSVMWLTSHFASNHMFHYSYFFFMWVYFSTEKGISLIWFIETCLVT